MQQSASHIVSFTLKNSFPVNDMYINTVIIVKMPNIMSRSKNKDGTFINPQVKSLDGLIQNPIIIPLNNSNDPSL